MDKDFTLEQLQFIHGNLIGMNVPLNRPDRREIVIIADDCIKILEAKIAEIQTPKLASAPKEKLA